MTTPLDNRISLLDFKSFHDSPHLVRIMDSVADLSLSFLKRLYLFILRQRGRVGEREGEKPQCVVASHTPPTGDPAYNPGMCPDWESNRRPFSSQAGVQSTELHQPGLRSCLLKTCILQSISHGPQNQAPPSLLRFLYS